MKPLAKVFGKVLDALTCGMPLGTARKIDNGAFMAVHVDRLSETTFSVAHYYKQNGDLVCDPDGVFLKTDVGWVPVTLQLSTGHYTVAVELDHNDRPTGWRPRQYRELSSFATMWLRNIVQHKAACPAFGGPSVLITAKESESWTMKNCGCCRGRSRTSRAGLAATVRESSTWRRTRSSNA